MPACRSKLESGRLPRCAIASRATSPTRLALGARSEGRDIPLTGSEFDLLRVFLERPGRLLSRDTVAEHLYGRASSDPLDRTVDVAMSRLRRKFGDNGVFRLFKTVRNGGYQFTARVVREMRDP